MLIPGFNMNWIWHHIYYKLSLFHCISEGWNFKNCWYFFLVWCNRNESQVVYICVVDISIPQKCFRIIMFELCKFSRIYKLIGKVIWRSKVCVNFLVAVFWQKSFGKCIFTMIFYSNTIKQTRLTDLQYSIYMVLIHIHFKG